MSVLAGVRKLSNAGIGIVLETSVDSFTNDGSFGFFDKSGNAATDILFRAGGVTPAQVTPANFAAPLTFVLTAQDSISTPELSVRTNALQVATSTATQGTGNFGNYPLYLGGRAGTGIYFNGRLHSLIVLGRTVTPTELTQTEGYVETKTFGKDMAYVYSDALLGPDGEQLLVTDGGDALFMTVSYE